MLLALEPITHERRDAARAEVRQWIADLEKAGITVYTISKMCHRQYNTVKRWKESGRIEKCDGDMLKAIHAEFCA